MVQPAPGVVPVQPQPRSTWWIVPLVIVGLVIVAWLLLAGLPFGGEKKQVATVTSETIAEGTVATAPAETGTVVEVGTAEEPPFVTQTAPPPLATQTIPTMTATPPVIVEEPPRPTPRPAPPVQTPPVQTPPVQPKPQPQPPREEPSGEISEAEATAALRNHLGAANPYDVSTSCLQLRSAGYRNVGYTYSVWDSCVEGGGSRMLGRWRVDAKTREVFRQGDDGRYLRP